jgi:hypothetical protein
MRSRIIRAIMFGALSATATLYGVGSCVGEQLWRFNPCGTILSTNICTPSSWYARLFDAPDWNVDPTCPIPFQCGPGAGGPAPTP